MEGPARHAALASAVLVFSLTLLSAAPAARATVPVLTRQGLVLPVGPAGSIDSLQAFFPSVIITHGVYRMWYSACDTSYYCQIAYATSTNGKTWSKQGAVLSPAGGNESLIAYANVVLAAGSYWMFYGGSIGGGYPTYRIYVATSSDGMIWTRQGVAVDLGALGAPDADGAVYPSVLVVNGTFTMFYTGLNAPSPPANGAIMRAASIDGIHWTKDGIVLAPGSTGSMDAYNVQAASVVRVASSYEMLYNGMPDGSAGFILSAESSDSIHWRKTGEVLAPLPGRENLLGQPDIVITSSGAWNVYYVVRNDVSDLQIYMAAGASPVSVPPIPPPTAVMWLEVLGTTGAGGAIGGLCAWGVERARRQRQS